MLNPLKKLLQKLKKLNLTSTLIFSSILFSAYGSKEPLLVLVSQDQKEFSFQLPSNPSTGYRWKILDYDHQKLSYTKVQYIASKPQLMGSGGFERFYFKKLGSKPFKTIIKLTYQRPWEKNSGLIQVVNVSITP